MNLSKIMVYLSVFIITAGLANLAHARPDVQTMSCLQAKTLVAQKGAVVLTFSNMRYDRVVRSSRFCSSIREKTEPITVATRDTARCNIGKRCSGEVRSIFRPFGFDD